METTTAVATDADAVAELHTAGWRRAYATLDRVLCGEADQSLVAADGCGEAEEGQVVAGMA
ncbi:hypothetical protein ACH4MA_25440, partial [Streptomyces roseolus]|uniref:hypothetical protein n=1 Tax=Streptomyces roseolus TaxID=67358 RepID=UPI0037B64124